MPTILPNPNPRRPLSTLSHEPAGGAQPAVGFHTAWMCLAGFFASAAEAQETARQLALAVGAVPASSWRVIGPAEGAWWRYRQLSRHWALRAHAAGQSWSDDGGLMALLGATLAGLLMALWLVLSDDAGVGTAWMPMLGSAVVGAVAGMLCALLGVRQRQYRRFNHTVRRQLLAGRWAVLANDITPLQQDRVQALVRRRCLQWCSVSPEGHWL